MGRATGTQGGNGTSIHLAMKRGYLGGFISNVTGGGATGTWKKRKSLQKGKLKRGGIREPGAPLVQKSKGKI